MKDLNGSSAVVDSLGVGAAALDGSAAYVLSDSGSPAVLAGALIWAQRNAAATLTLFCDSDADVVARLASYFDFDIEIRWARAGSEPPEQMPLPVVPPRPDDAEDLLAQLESHGLEIVLEDGSWRGEVLGLEVARIVRWPQESGGDGELHIEAGVGRFDRDAAAVMHQGESPSDALERATTIVGRHRFSGAGTHALSLLARPRWLRSTAIGDPARVGASELHAVQTTNPADNVRDAYPAAAAGTDADGSEVLVVFGAGVDLSLVPIGADTRELYARECKLRFVLPAGDALAPIRQLVDTLVKPAELIEIDPEWT